MSDIKLALNDVHESLGGKMIPFAGYVMPVRYSSDKEEHITVREKVGIFDVSHMGEFALKGEGALDLLQKVTTNDVSKLVPGKAQYNCLPNLEGGIVDDLIIYMKGENDYFLVVNASNIEKDWNWISQFADDSVEMKNVSSDYCLFAVQGPLATSALQKLTDVQLSEVKYYSFVEGEIAGVSEVIISATGYTGAGGFELYVPVARAVEVWNKVLEAGEEFGIKPIGLGARDTLRLEMGFCLYGNDIDDTTSPIEAGLGWITKFTKDFNGREIIEKVKTEGPSRKLVGFKMIDRGIPRGGYNILDADGSKIGHVTSGTMSPLLNIGIGLGYVELPYTKPESEIFIEVRNKSIKAQVHKLPLI